MKLNLLVISFLAILITSFIGCTQRNGIVDKGSVVGSQCNVNTDCGEGNFCNAQNVCQETPVNQVCSSDSDCDANLTCGDDGFCKPIETAPDEDKCTTTSDCSPTQICNASGKCVAPADDDECVVNSQCDDGFKCVSKNCVALGDGECVKDADCETGTYCLVGKCEEKIKEDGYCESSSACEDGLVCLENKCLTCTESETDGDVPSCYKATAQIDVEFQPTEALPIDIVFVIDNSGSMEKYALDIAGNIAVLIDQLDEDSDFKVGALFLELDEPTYGEIIEIGTSSDNFGPTQMSAAFLSAVQDQKDANHGFTGGSAEESAITETLMALTVKRSVNDSFFRDDAYLNIIYLSDENDICYVAGEAIPSAGREGDSSINQFCKTDGTLAWQTEYRAWAKKNGKTENISILNNGGVAKLINEMTLQWENRFHVYSVGFTELKKGTPNGPKNYGEEFYWGGHNLSAYANGSKAISQIKTAEEIISEGGSQIESIASPDYSDFLFTMGVNFDMTSKLNDQFTLSHWPEPQNSIHVMIDSNELPAEDFEYKDNTNKIVLTNEENRGSPGSKITIIYNYNKNDPKNDSE